MSFDEFTAYFKRTAEAISKFRKKIAPKKAVAKRMNITEKQEAEFGLQELDLMAELPVGLCDDAPELTDSEKQQVYQQSSRAEKKFRSLDADGSGKLSGDEVLEVGSWVWRSFNPNKEPKLDQLKAEAAKILTRTDANGDGELDLEEFGRYYEKTAASIARFHKKKAAMVRDRKKKGSRNSSGATTPRSSRHTTPAQSPRLQAKIASASKSNSPHGTPNLGPAVDSVSPLEEEVLVAAAEDGPCIGSRESINMLPTKEYLDLTVMAPLLEGLHLVSKQNHEDPLEFLAQYLIDNDPLKHEQTTTAPTPAPAAPAPATGWLTTAPAPASARAAATSHLDTNFVLPEIRFDSHRLFSL